LSKKNMQQVTVRKKDNGGDIGVILHVPEKKKNGGVNAAKGLSESGRVEPRFREKKEVARKRSHGSFQRTNKKAA